MPDTLPFWVTKRLEEMTTAEWESLCDGCGRCCLHKLRDQDTDAILHTDVACRLLDLGTARCSDYGDRQRRVPDCVRLTPEELDGIDWLPPSCGYRRVRDGQDLPWWHPLVSGRDDSVHEAGISVRGRVVSERRAGPLEHHVVDWPGRMPRTRRPNAPPRVRRTASGGIASGGTVSGGTASGGPAVPRVMAVRDRP